MGPRSGTRPASGSSIEVSFYYKGVRCRERLKLKPTKANLRYAENLKGEIENAIAKGMFNYAGTFPNSTKVKMFVRIAGDAITIKEALLAWLTGVESHIERSTYLDYRNIVNNHLVPEFGMLKLSEFTRVHARDWASARDASRKRIANMLSPLRQMLADAVDAEQIEKNPLHGWTFKKREPVKNDDDIDPFTPEEQRAIIAMLPKQAANLIQFAFWTGLRTSELIAVEWGDIDWGRKVVRVRRAKVRGELKRPKTESGNREVKLLLPAIEALVAQKTHTYLLGNEIFHNPRTDSPWKDDGAIRKTAWIHALRKANIRYRRPYQTRHTYASMMLSAGENPVWVASQMGHRDWSMIIRVYGRWIPEVDPQAGEKAAQAWTTSDQKQSGKHSPCGE